MKIYFTKIALAFVLLCSTLGVAFSQSLQFVSKDETVNKTLNDETISYAVIKNVTLFSRTVKLTMVFESLTPGHACGFCWDVCWPPKTQNYTSPGTVTLEKNTTSGSTFHATLDNGGVVGKDVIRFVFWVDGSPEDSISYRATFTTTITGVTEEITPVNNETYALPVPASQSINITYSLINGNGQNELNVYNAAGVNVKQLPLDGASTQLNLNTGDLNNGVYYYTISSQGIIRQRNKFVIAR